MRFSVRPLLVLIALAALVPWLPTPAHAAAAPQALTQMQQYRAWMTEARVLYPYPQTVNKMYAVMRCESGGNPLAIGGGRWYGLFQYVPSTWRGAWNPYRAASIYDAKAQIFATAAAWHRGMQSAWSCYYLTH